MKKIKTPATPDCRPRPGRRWVRRIGVALGAMTVLGTTAAPANAGVWDPWDWRYNNPLCWPQDGPNMFGQCWGVAGNTITQPTFPTTRNMLEDCKNNRAFCKFYPTSRRAWINRVLLDNPEYNCSYSQTQSKTWSWDKTFSTTDTIGVGLTGTSNNLWNAFQLGVQANYSHSWTLSTRTATSLTQNLGPRTRGWVDRLQPIEEIKGWYRVNYTEPHWNHYQWDTATVTYAGPANNIRGTEGIWNGVVLYASNAFMDDRSVYPQCP